MACGCNVLLDKRYEEMKETHKQSSAIRVANFRGPIYSFTLFRLASIDRCIVNALRVSWVTDFP